MQLVEFLAANKWRQGNRYISLLHLGAKLFPTPPGNSQADLALLSNHPHLVDHPGEGRRHDCGARCALSAGCSSYNLLSSWTILTSEFWSYRKSGSRKGNFMNCTRIQELKQRPRQAICHHCSSMLLTQLQGYAKLDIITSG